MSQSRQVFLRDLSDTFYRSLVRLRRFACTTHGYSMDCISSNPCPTPYLAIPHGGGSHDRTRPPMDRTLKRFEVKSFTTRNLPFQPTIEHRFATGASIVLATFRIGKIYYCVWGIPGLSARFKLNIG